MISRRIPHKNQWFECPCNCAINRYLYYVHNAHRPYIQQYITTLNLKKKPRLIVNIVFFQHDNNNTTPAVYNWYYSMISS